VSTAEVPGLESGVGLGELLVVSSFHYCIY